MKFIIPDHKTKIQFFLHHCHGAIPESKVIQLENDLLSRIKNIPEDSVIRLNIKYPVNLPLLSVKLLDSIILRTMNYQVSVF
jgi:hypothetical protein